MLTKNTDLGDGYFNIKHLKYKWTVDYNTGQTNLADAINSNLKGVNYKPWFDYVTTRTYKTGGASDLTILL